MTLSLGPRIKNKVISGLCIWKVTVVVFKADVMADENL